METVRSVERALDILLAFDSEHDKLSLTELTLKTGLAKTTVVRLIATLESKGFLIKDQLQQEYRLGIALIRLGSIALRNNSLREISLPVMRRIWQLTHESVSLNIVRDYHRICIEQILSDQGLSQQATIGKPIPMWRGASGKLLFAFLPSDEQEKVFEVALKEDIQAAQNWDEIIERSNEIKAQGYAISFNERILGAAAISTPIFDQHDNAIAGLAISGPTVRFTEEQVTKFIDLAIKGAQEISEQLGCSDGLLNK